MQIRTLPTDRRFLVSVIVAAWPDDTGLAACLDSLERQRNDQVEIMVVGMVEPPGELVRRFSGVQWRMAARNALIPHLWAHGMAAATGDVVAITTAHFVPGPDWIAQIYAAFRRLDADGIGGPIDPPHGGGGAAWATYFLRYSVQFRHREEKWVEDVAGDNAAYRRTALQRHPDATRDGFWEPEFHRRVIAEGRRLAFVPEMRLTPGSCLGIWPFCAQRFHHGQQHGRDRLAGKPALERAVRIFTAPMIPLVVLVKITQRLRHRPAYLPAFVGALPALVLFVCAWALGETVGYLNIGQRIGASGKALHGVLA